jgi:hypothetical protein
MRAAKASELTERAVPVLAAKLSESELSNWIPVTFQEINDPEATPEPSKGVLLKLAAGPYVVLFYGKETGQLVLQLPLSQNASANVRHFFHEVPIPISRVVWHRPDVELPRSKRVSTSPSRPAKPLARMSPTGKFATRDQTPSRSKASPSRSRASKKR